MAKTISNYDSAGNIIDFTVISSSGVQHSGNTRLLDIHESIRPDAHIDIGAIAVNTATRIEELETRLEEGIAKDSDVNQVDLALRAAREVVASTGNQLGQAYSDLANADAVNPSSNIGVSHNRGGITID